ncbi:hypothetical protein F8388_025279 [Cannabis sativa]|uniref:Uncharacterized protein n=1 Tax=Cannabis sativa TaxID=3483 RepID=A0A7J6FSC8_CANSA|nr:hypothetical protein F8388_025279 [Cannabis sativa]
MRSLKNLSRIAITLLACCFFLEKKVYGENYSFDLNVHLKNASKPEELMIKKSDFPSDFVFGVATAAAQIEGSVNGEGKGESIWDNFVKTNPVKIADRSNMTTAIDSYKRFMSDIEAISKLGVKSYRFSIAWTRILPNGSLSGGVNEAGISHYNNLINELVKRGIKPYVTLLHFDSPQALQEKFGDRVKNWVTINEPLIVAQMGYDLGVAAPGRCSFPFLAGPCTEGNSTTEPYIVTHNMLLAHATAVKLYRRKFQKTQGGEIGITLVGKYFEPYSETRDDIAATKRLMDFQVKNRLPKFTLKQKKLVQGSFDFIGINYYTSRFAKSKPPSFPSRFTTDALATEESHKINGSLIGPKAKGSITEVNDPNKPLEVALNDPHRIINTLRHLYKIHQAMQYGVNVKGYFYWSLFDDFEWGEGFLPRFGLYYIDYKNNLNRIPKESAKWFNRFLNGH